MSVWIARSWLFLCACLVLVPVAVIVSALGEFDSEIWEFLLDYQLPLLLKNTLFLSSLVTIGVIFLGTTSAWLLSVYRFGLSRHLSWAMMLPLAMPAYVIGFVQVGFFEYSGWASTYLREVWGFEQGLPNIRNGVGLSIAMSLAFYPYVYLLAKNAFDGMGQQALEAGASLGLTPFWSFIKIALPMARPWIAGGAILALMEVLADFGAVSVFSYETFTTAIYDAWFGFFSLQTAKQLASLLLGFVLIVVILEQLQRKKQRFTQMGRSHTQQKQLPKKWSILASVYCLGILALGFILPIIQLIIWAYQLPNKPWGDLWEQTWHSVSVAFLAAIVVVILAFLVALSTRMDKSKSATILAKISTMGYAIPGTVLAVGVFVPVAWLDNLLINRFNLTVSEIFKGTLLVMILALAIRFLALGLSSVQAGMERIRPSYVEASHALGVTGVGVIQKIYLPLLKSAMGTAMLMTFVDVMKEMPITLMMRPTNWDMLAVRVFSFTSEGLYDKAALPALVIVVAGLIPVVLFSKLK